MDFSVRFLVETQRACVRMRTAWVGVWCLLLMSVYGTWIVWRVLRVRLGFVRCLVHAPLCMILCVVLMTRPISIFAWRAVCALWWRRLVRAVRQMRLTAVISSATTVGTSISMVVSFVRVDRTPFVSVSPKKTQSVARIAGPTATVARLAALASSLGTKVLVCSLLLGHASACEPALVSYAPEQLLTVPMTFFPVSSRRGREITLIALPALSSDLNHDIFAYDFGPGITVSRLDTAEGLGCQQNAVAQILDLLGETTQDRYPICFSVAIAEDAPLGARTMRLELTSEGQGVIARSPFTVLSDEGAP